MPGCTGFPFVFSRPHLSLLLSPGLFLIAGRLQVSWPWWLGTGLGAKVSSIPHPNPLRWTQRVERIQKRRKKNKKKTARNKNQRAAVGTAPRVRQRDASCATSTQSTEATGGFQSRAANGLVVPSRTGRSTLPVNRSLLDGRSWGGAATPHVS
jgi:hypothetical protein